MKTAIRSMNYITGLYVHNIIISAVKRVEFLSGRMPYIILGGRWYHASTMGRIDNFGNHMKS
jgi:hypothetical protein